MSDPETQHGNGRVTVPTSVLLGLLGLAIGSGAGIPIYRATASPGPSREEFSALEKQVHEVRPVAVRVDERLRTIELDARANAEWRVTVDEKLRLISDDIRTVAAGMRRPRGSP